MTGVLLDIGAGNKTFVRTFRKLNPHAALTFLCGEPEFCGEWDGQVVEGRTQNIFAYYDNFNVPDASLNMVTLNGFHPFSLPCGIGKELVRCLKPGGMFFSAHPAAMHPCLDPYEFDIIVYGVTPTGEPQYDLRFQQVRKGFRRWFCAPLTINRSPMIVYPASRTVEYRLISLAATRQYGIGTDPAYVYRGVTTEPSVRVWVKR